MMHPAQQRASSEAVRLHLAHRERLRRIEAKAYRPPPPVAPVIYPPIPAAVLKKPEPPKPERLILPPSVERPRRVLRAVANEFGISVDDMIGRNREHKYTIPRYVVAGILCELGFSLPQIGRALGGRDHTTALNARRRFEQLAASEAFRNRVDQIKAEALR